ncbi:MAG: endo-1,4-beta-xylanase, partial [bacterium]|nr:endo-1,4-beta-xylanase [bacterium]
MNKKIYYLLFYSLSIFLYFNLSAQSDPYKHEPSRVQFGINALKTFHIPDQLYTEVSTRMGYMQELGVKWDRSDFWWHKIEPNRGIFDFTFPDQAVAFYEKNQIQMYPILCYHSNWAKDGAAPATKEEQELFANYVYQCVKRYKSRLTYWELWNEPNILPFWKPNPNAEQYTSLLKKSYIAAKKANPDCQIVGICIAGYDPEFLERVYQLG